MFHIDRQRFPFKGPVDFQELTQQGIEEHDHEFYEIAVALSGRGWHTSGSHLLPVESRDVFIIPIGTPHSWVRDSHLQLLNIYYTRSDFFSLIGTLSPLRSLFFASDFENPHMRPAIYFRISEKTLCAIRYELFEMRAGLASCPGYAFQAGCFLKILSRFSNDYAAHYGITRIDQLLRPAVNRLMEMIDQHALAGEPLDLEIHASQFGMSGDQLTRIFKESITISPYKFFIQRRLFYAQALLRSTDKTCTEIAHSLGFSDGAHFSRTFREHYQMSPIEWRRIKAPKHIS